MSEQKDPVVDFELARAHGLTDGEYALILEILGRTPTYPELGIFSVMWSEHCSYKSSKVHLKTLPTTGKAVLQGPGENAGAVDIGEGLAAVFKIESHNHPSFISPVQGAATGVGGILRDIFTMGARPTASLDSIRFGPIEDPKHQYLLHGVVEGIGGYGNPVGVATVGGETQFHECYRGNILVNAFNLGIVDAERIFRAKAVGIGNPVIYAGSKTGRDGIHGASLLASAEFDEKTEEKLPTVQVGDPFTEKCLIEACLELMATDHIVGIQDMGAAGLTSSSFEMASSAGTGIEMNLDRIPTRAADLTPYEMLLSESQERMLMVAKAGREAEVCKIFERWGLDAVVVGKVTDTGRMVIRWRGQTVVDIPVDPVADNAPELKRPYARPAEQDQRQSLKLESVEIEHDLPGALEALLDSPNLGSKEWVYRQYDQRVQGNTVLAPSGDAALIRVKHSDGTPTLRGLAMSVDCNPRWCFLDPYAGTLAAVAEAARNVACTGARPLAVTNCLNFGNPEKPDVMWQLVESIRGLGDACRAFDTPVISGNVSLYNETAGRAIYPTPTIVMVGLIDNWQRHSVSHFTMSDLSIVLLGETREELAGSEWLALRRGIEAGMPPKVDLVHERRLQNFLCESIAKGTVRTAHDISDGGLAVALAEMCFTAPDGCSVGASVQLEKTMRLDAQLFGESTGRVLVATAEPAAVLSAAKAHGVPAQRIGQTGGEQFRIASTDGEVWIDFPVTHLKKIWKRAIPRRLSDGGSDENGA